MKKTKNLMEGGNDLCARFTQSVIRRGGCSKTSVTLNLGIGLAMEGMRVALIDADPHVYLFYDFAKPILRYLPYR